MAETIIDDQMRVARVAAALFGTDSFTRRRLMAVVAESAPGVGFERAVETWLHGYTERLLPPVLHGFFHHGIVHEVHRAISYGDEQGWKRIAYRLFVNNLSETVAALAGFFHWLARVRVFPKPSSDSSLVPPKQGTG